MPHFFINSNQINNNTITINDSENYNHIAKSLRIKVGENLLLIDEKQIQYETVVSKVTNKEIYCNIIKNYKSLRDLTFDLYLAQSPLRSDSQLTIIEKATELGVRGIYPIITDNCVLKKSILEKKHEKWQKIMVEASKQCERAIIPTCFEPTNIEKVLENNFDKIIVFGERSTEQSLKDYLTKNIIKQNEKVLIIIGPEGGFSSKEFNFFKEKGLPIITLGDLILKAETAVITAIGNITYEYKG